jgi:hypothetical protein
LPSRKLRAARAVRRRNAPNGVVLSEEPFFVKVIRSWNRNIIVEIIKQLFVVNSTVAVTVKDSCEATDLLRCKT